jgi:hypothetical protein
MKRNKLKLTLEWDNFLKSEWKQLDRYAKVGMFGAPVKADQWMTILPWVWSYVNRIPVMVPLTAPLLGVIFRGHISLKNWPKRLLLRHDTTSFKTTCLFIY